MNAELAAASSALLAQLEALLGRQHVITDPVECEFHSTDIYSAGQLPLAVVRPASTADVA